MSVEERLARLEKKRAVTSVFLATLLVGLVGFAGYQSYKLHQLETATTLRVKEIRIYDDKGVDRVVVAGNLPQATLNGKPRNFKPRQMGGILIYDASGTERGGYGTTDGYANAMLSLDSGAEEKGKQVMLLLAEPGGGAFLRQWEGSGSVTMGVYDKPFLTVMDGKDVVFAKPEGNEWTKRGDKIAVGCSQYARRPMLPPPPRCDRVLNGHLHRERPWSFFMPSGGRSNRGGQRCGLKHYVAGRFKSPSQG